MFCGKCGVRLPDDAVKCDRCGAPVRIRSAYMKNQGQSGADKGMASKQTPVKQSEPDKEIQEPVQDPVYFEDAGDKVDVRSILRIARGEEPDAAEEPGDSPEEEGSAVTIKEVRPSLEPRKRPKQSVRQEQPVSAAGTARHPGMSREAYMESLPLKERVRRRVSEALHTREEAAEARRMRSHLVRAAKYYGVELSEEDLKAPVPARSDNRESHEAIEEQVSRERAEKVRDRLEERQVSVPEKTSAQTVNVEADAAGDAAAEKAKTEKSAAITAAPAKAADPTGGAVAAIPEAPAEAGGESAEKAVIEKAAEKEQAAPAKAADPTGGAAAAIPEAPAEAGGESAEKAARAKAAETEAAKAAEERAAAILRREQVEEFRRQQEYNARVLQRYREDAPDQVDRMLGRYGLSKETTVRLATLFLIAVLSVIYVMGRNKQPDLVDVPVAGEGMTGSSAVTDTDSGMSGEEESGDSENPEEDTSEKPAP